MARYYPISVARRRFTGQFGTVYFPIHEGGENTTGTIGQQASIIPGTCKMTRLTVEVNEDLGSGKTMTATVVINGVDSSLTATVGNGTTLDMGTTEVTLNPGDRVTLKLACAGGSWSPTTQRFFSIYYSMYTTEWQWFSGTTGAANLQSNPVTSYVTFQGDTSNSSTIKSRTKQIPVSGTLADLYVEIGAAPGTGNSWTFTLMVNEVDTGITATISDSATTANSGNSYPINAGDNVTVRATASINTLPSINLRYGFKFIPDDERARVATVEVLALNAADRFYYAGAHALDKTSEYQTRSGVAARTRINLIRLYHIESPGTGKSYTLTAMKNGSDTSLFTTISDSETSDYNIVDYFEAAQNDYLTIKRTSSGGPATTGGTNYYSIAYDVPGFFGTSQLVNLISIR